MIGHAHRNDPGGERAGGDPRQRQRRQRLREAAQRDEHARAGAADRGHAVFAEAVADRPDDELHRAVHQRIGRDDDRGDADRRAQIGRDLRQQRIGRAHHRLAGEAGDGQKHDGAGVGARRQRVRARDFNLSGPHYSGRFSPSAAGPPTAQPGVDSITCRGLCTRRIEMAAMIEKTYQPAEIEARISAAWESAQAFRAGRPDRADAQPYCIVIPPPNVTGSLHMGHALNNTLQDVLCRFERMRGRDVLWQPGTDHAGIATQMVVERQLMERQQPSRRELGREKFLERVWDWKAESGGTIINQLKRLGASCDWSRERFTMDEGLSRAVVKVFVELYQAPG